MPKKTLGLIAIATALILGMAAVAQPPEQPGFQGKGGKGQKGKGGKDGKGKGKDKGGLGAGLERILDDMNLPESKHEAAGAAIRVHQGDLRRLADLARADLLLKMKDILNEEEYHKLREATDALRDGPGRGGRGATQDDIIDRIMSFDANKDGKVTREELPERMQSLVQGDGALDTDAIRKLAADLAREEPVQARGPRGRGGPDGQGKGGRGPRGGPPPLPPAALERVINELNLPEAKKTIATAAVQTHRENLRTLTTLARADLLLQLNGILSESEYTSFRTALERQPNLGDPFPGRGGRRGGG